MIQNQTKIWRVIDLINWGESYFKSKAVSNARREVEWLLCHILNCRRIDLYLEFEKPVFEKDLRLFKSFFQRRLSGEPFQHIIGKAPFYGRDFTVNSNVLIPRPETEVIIDVLKQRGGRSDVLEVGTGSGCIAVTLIKENLADHVIATDISKEALEIARENAARLEAENISFRRHDFLKDPISSKFDVVVSNPPYVGKDEIAGLDPVVVKYDPLEALTDHSDGVSFYRRFADTGHRLLRPGGVIVLEIGGSHQREIIGSLFTAADYLISFHDDLQHDPRVAVITPKTD